MSDFIVLTGAADTGHVGSFRAPAPRHANASRTVLQGKSLGTGKFSESN